MAPLKWLFESDEIGLTEVLALDRAMAFDLAPKGARLLDSRPLFEAGWDLEYQIPGPAEPRLSAGIQPVSYRRMTEAEKRSF